MIHINLIPQHISGSGLPSNRLSVRSLVAALLLSAAILIGLKPGYHLGRRIWEQHRLERIWAGKPLPGQAQIGDPVYRIQARDIGLDTLVLLGLNHENLDRYPATDEIGGSQSLIFGHRDAHFRKLKDVSRETVFEITDLQGSQTYRAAYHLTVEMGALEETLARLQHEPFVLVTCFPFHYMGSAPQRRLIILYPEASSAGTILDDDLM